MNSDLEENLHKLYEAACKRIAQLERERDEAFNEGVEKSAEYIDGSDFPRYLSVCIRNLKRPIEQKKESE